MDSHQRRLVQREMDRLDQKPISAQEAKAKGAARERANRMGEPATINWSFSDKLAIALACLAGVMAIILFWIDKTPLAASISLAAMVGLMVYPILHVFHSTSRRIIAGVIALALVCVFGWRIWPRKAIDKAAPIAGQSEVTTAPIPTEVRSWDGGKAPMTDEEKKIERQIEAEYHAKFPGSHSLGEEKEWINKELVARGITSFRLMEVTDMTPAQKKAAQQKEIALATKYELEYRKLYPHSNSAADQRDWVNAKLRAHGSKTTVKCPPAFAGTGNYTTVDNLVVLSTCNNLIEFHGDFNTFTNVTGISTEGQKVLREPDKPAPTKPPQ